jgi:holo-[acyl-carrier protein] synthase
VQNRDGVVASALELVAIAEVAGVPPGTFSPAERAYAASKSDPERRLAARLAAKRALAGLLGLAGGEIEVQAVRGGPPRLGLSERAAARLRETGATRALVSLSHGRTHAVAVVLLLQP